MGYAVVDQKPHVPRQAGAAVEPAQPRLQEGLGLCLECCARSAIIVAPMSPRPGMCRDEVRAVNQSRKGFLCAYWLWRSCLSARSQCRHMARRTIHTIRFAYRVTRLAAVT